MPSLLMAPPQIPVATPLLTRELYLMADGDTSTDSRLLLVEHHSSAAQRLQWPTSMLKSQARQPVRATWKDTTSIRALPTSRSASRLAASRIRSRVKISRARRILQGKPARAVSIPELLCSLAGSSLLTINRFAMIWLCSILRIGLGQWQLGLVDRGRLILEERLYRVQTIPSGSWVRTHWVRRYFIYWERWWQHSYR